MNFLFTCQGYRDIRRMLESALLLCLTWLFAEERRECERTRPPTYVMLSYIYNNLLRN